MALTVAVTGATGHIGRAVADAVAAAGHNVRRLVRRVPMGAEPGSFAIIDLTKPESLGDALAGCDAILHCGINWDDPGASERGLAAHLEATGFAGRLVITGGVWIFGPDARDADEGAPPYALDTFDGMDAVWPRFRALGNALRVHPGLVWSEAEAPWAAETPGARPQPGHQLWPMVHADDLARAYVAALTSGSPGDEFLVVAESLPAEQVMASYGSTGPVRRIPADDPYAWSQTFSCARAKAVLGWAPTRFIGQTLAA